MTKEEQLHRAIKIAVKAHKGQKTSTMLHISIMF